MFFFRTSFFQTKRFGHGIALSLLKFFPLLHSIRKIRRNHYLLAIFKFLLQMTNLTLMTQTLNVYLYGWKFSTYLIKSSWKSIAHIPGNLLWEFPIHLGWQFTLALKILANNPLSVMWAVHLIIGQSTGQSNICLFLHLAMYSCLFTSQEVTKASKATHY